MKKLLDIINKYRNSPNRTWIHLAVKTDLIMGGREIMCDSKDALVDIKCVKRGGFTCKRDLNIRLCDICIIGGAAALCWWFADKMMRDKNN